MASTAASLSQPPVPRKYLCRSLTVVLVRPTRYDEDGYVVRHWRGTLPSNTLSCLNGLTEDAVTSGALGTLPVTVLAFDEAVDRIDPRRLGRKLRRPGARVLVALAGVQTNQFSRARDLARQFLAEGFDVMIGGFHVSGSTATAHGLTPDCQAVIDDGVTLVLGEVEDHWARLLQDAAAGRLKPVYDFLATPPDLDAKPLPKVSLRLQTKFAVRGYGTIDAGRGCPFTCSFCTIINVQGRTMRSRGATHIINHIRSHYRINGRRGINHYFFTDDNFSRNPQWEAILDGLIDLREREGIAIDFMMQVDTAASRIPRFVDKAARAGCVQVFIGMESLRDDNLKAAGKRQNRVHTYRDSIARWHEAGILCHVGFIIGFPHDTYDRIMEDVRTLRDELLVDQASFFVLTPLPGSRDHRDAVLAGVPMDPDFNNYDSFRVTTPHPLMSDEEWMRAYRDAWTSFYSFEHMRKALLRQNPHTYWGMLKCFLWYRASMVEGTHPMVTGFVRLKDRRSRRPGFPVEGRLPFLKRRLRDLTRLTVGYAALVLEMQELWLATRIRRDEYAFVGDLRALKSKAAAALDVKTRWSQLHAELAHRFDDLRASAEGPASRAGVAMAERLEALKQALGTRADELARAAAATRDLRLPSLPPLGPPSFVRRLARRVNVFRPPTLEARQALTAYWQRTSADLRSWRLWRLNPMLLAWNGLRDAKNTIVFFAVMTLERY
ncbi:MAG TPA: radical SAM protein [Vicinamibacterales bacterium]|nr:radical SAM protein [Vicinamibacterales bacterium]